MLKGTFSKLLSILALFYSGQTDQRHLSQYFIYYTQAYDDKMLAQYEAEDNEREMRKYRSITDGPHAAELLDDLKKRVYETQDKVNRNASL